MLENCRVNKGEKSDDEVLARKIAALCDVYVNDAFGTAHRAEATTHGVARFAKVACAGPLMAAELDALGKRSPAGAAARRDRGRLEGVDQAHGARRAREQSRQPDRRRRHRQHLPARRRQADREIARRADLAGEAKRIMKKTKVPLPSDVVVEGGKAKPVEAVGKDEMILDIGPDTARHSPQS